MRNAQATARQVVARIAKYLFALAFLSPFYISFVYAVKTKQEIAFTGLAFPRQIHLENFINGLRMSNFFLALRNTLFATIVGTVVLTVVCSMAAYIITRKKTRLYGMAYSLFLVTILIPFQAMMFPLYLILKEWGMVNTLIGFTLVKVGSQVGFCILMMAGFVKTIPIDIEEATFVDGGGRYRTFWQIVFPLMKPIIITSVVINALSIWNDFSASIVLLQKKEVAILPLMVYYFFGENVVELNIAFAVFALSMIPILLLYLIAQKYIVSGMMLGAIKG
jgi:raffinose/stachyose/melibiose transport system permease protein